MKNNRVILRRNSSYITKKKKIIKSKTPGNNLKVIFKKKKYSPVKCALSKLKLKGLSNPNSLKFINICKRKKKISRIYGGNLSSNILRERIIKAFLNEEQKINTMIQKNKRK
jgi:large subunit ribosomal protein L34e